MVLMIALVSVFGFLVAAMAWAPIAAEALERDQRELAAARRPLPVSLAARRARTVAATGTNEPHAA